MNTLVTTDWLALAPVLAPALGAVAVLVLDAIAPRMRMGWFAVAALALIVGMATALPGALGSVTEPARTLCLTGTEGVCMWSAGPLSSTLQLAANATALAVLGLYAARISSSVPVLMILVSATGAAMVAAAVDLGSWLIGLEMATLPTIALVALRGERRSGGGALTLLVTSVFSFALLVVGAGLWLIGTGTPAFAPGPVALAWADSVHRAPLTLAILFFIAGIGFKLSLVPFHSWTPQVFASAPMPVTALLASLSKVAALGALIVALAPFAALVQGHASVLVVVVGLIAVLSMLLGTIMAFRQSDIVRVLAWSTVAQAGWAVFPLTSLTEGGARAAAAYLLVYAITSLVAFGAIALFHSAGSRDPETRLAAYQGVLRDHPVSGGVLALAILVLAGLPPGFIGLFTKVAALKAVIGADLWWLGLAGVVATALGIAAYVRVIAVMLAPRDAADEPLTVIPARGVTAVIGVGAAVLVVLSVLPQGMFGLLG